MTRLQFAALLSPRPARSAHPVRNPQPIAPALVEPTPDPTSTDLPPYAERVDPQLEDIPTQLAVGSDGRLYMTVDALPESVRRGRRVFVGVALTQEEAAFATKAIEDASARVAQSVWTMLLTGNSAQ